jgi:hypothetical protein
VPRCPLVRAGRASAKGFSHECERVERGRHASGRFLPGWQLVSHAARALARRARRLASTSTRERAATSAGVSPTGTNRPAPSPTSSGIAPVMRGNDRESVRHASATAIPYVSCRVASTKTSALS